jgi:hypothetical protein
MGHLAAMPRWSSIAPDHRDHLAETTREDVVLVVGAAPRLTGLLRFLGGFLRLGISVVPEVADLSRVLREQRPMAVMIEADIHTDEGCQLMKTVGHFDRSLPVLLVAGDDPTILGTLDAIEELWQLTAVRKIDHGSDVEAVMDFLSHAGRRHGTARMMRA